jgi:hypothetical protein
MRAERLFVAAATTVFVVSATPAPAHDRTAIMRACAGDIERLCAGVKPGGGRIKTCMKKKITKVSAPCINAVLRAIAAKK